MKDVQKILIRPRNESYVSELQKSKSQWEKNECTGYNQKWIAKCQKCRAEPKQSGCVDFTGVSCENAVDSYVDGNLFVAYDSNLKNIEKISCLEDTFLTKEQLNFYVKNSSFLEERMDSIDLQLIVDPTICMGISTGVTEMVWWLSSTFFMYKILPVLYRPKTMAFVSHIEFSSIEDVTDNILKIDFHSLRDLLKNHMYPILPSWNIRLITVQGRPLLIEFVDPKNVEISLEFYLPILEQIDWTDEEVQIEISNKVFENPFELIIPPNFEWEEKNIEDLKNQVRWSDEVQQLYEKKKFNFSEWIVGQMREIVARQKILKLCISDFQKLYRTAKKYFPDYLKYGINIGHPEHATAAIFDSQAKRVLYFNTHGQVFWRDSEAGLSKNALFSSGSEHPSWMKLRTNQGVPFFLSKVIQEQKKYCGDPTAITKSGEKIFTGDECGMWESGWRLNWNTKSTQISSASCGLHSLFFFWYGCCNSFPTIKRFWNLSPLKDEEKDVEQEGEIARKAEKELFLTFLEVLVNQLTEMTRFLMGTCLKKCKGQTDEIETYKQLFTILMRCDLYGIELGNEIQKLMPTAQFLVRVFGLKLGRAIMPKNVLDDIRESANVRNAWKEHEAWLAEERKRNEEVDAHWKEWEDTKILLRKQEARKALKQDIEQL